MCDEMKDENEMCLFRKMFETNAILELLSFVKTEPIYHNLPNIFCCYIFLVHRFLFQKESRFSMVFKHSLNINVWSTDLCLAIEEKLDSGKREETDIWYCRQLNWWADRWTAKASIFFLSKNKWQIGSFNFWNLFKFHVPFGWVLTYFLLKTIKVDKRQFFKF